LQSLKYLRLVVQHNDVTSEQLLALLKTCPSLEQVKSESYLRPPPPSDIQPPVITTLHKLQYLELRIEESEILLDHITVPALKHFAFYHGPEWPHLSFLSLLSRSASQLLSLDLLQTEISETELLDCLRALPTLETLQIRDSDLDWEVLFDAMRYTVGNNQTLVPNLHSFNFEPFDEQWSDFPPLASSFMKMVESRWWLGPPPSGGKQCVVPLQRAHVYVYFKESHMDYRVFCRLNGLRDQGLDVELGPWYMRDQSVHGFFKEAPPHLREERGCSIS
jgi:hypothetical protein